MQAIVKKWGNSLGIRFPLAYAKETGIENGSTVEMTIDAGKIVITPVKQKSQYTLEELLAGIDENNLPEYIDDGGPVGKEWL